MARCFIGIDLPLEIKEQLHSAFKKIQTNTKGWENFHDYHQTLLFIGEVKNSDIEKIKKKMDQVNFCPFILRTSVLKFFKRRVLYLDFDHSGPLFSLAEMVRDLFSEWDREGEKNFLPHVTVKRWQRYEYEELGKGIEQLQLKQYEFLVQSVCLFKSERDAYNQKYHVIHRSPLMTLSCHSAMDSLG